MGQQKNNSPYESVLAVAFLLLLVHYFFPQPFGVPVIIGYILITLLSGTIAQAIHWFWQQLTQAIGWVMSKLLLSIVFFIFLTPLAILYRFFKNKPKDSSASNFIDRNHTFEAEDIAHPW